MKNLEDHLLQYLLKPGQTVYIQGSRIHGNRESKVTLVSYTEDKAIDFFTNCHGKIIDSDDFTSICDEQKLGREVQIVNGQLGIIVSSFHWAYTEKEKLELVENKKLDSTEQASASLMSLVFVNDMLVLSSDKNLNAIDV